MIDWDFKCNGDIPSLLAKPTEVESVNGTVKLVTVVAFLTCIVAIISSLVLVVTLGKPYLDHKFRVHYKVFLLVKVIALGLLLPFILIGIIRVSSFKSGFKSLVDKGCTSQDVSDNLMNMVKAMDTNTLPMYVVSLLLIILNVSVDFCLYSCLKKNYDFENFNGGAP